MPDSSQAPQGQRRANWVALRTLRQRPKVAGVTKEGETVYEVKSVRLVLRGNSPHFNRLVQCSKCQRDVVGSEVTTADELDRTPFPVICRECVRGSTSSVAWRREERHEPPAPPPPATPEPSVDPVIVLPAAPPAGTDRLDALDDQLKDVGARLAEVARRAERPADDKLTLNAVHSAVREGFIRARAEIAASTEAAERRAGALEARLGQEVTRLITLVDAQGTEAAALGASVAEIRSVEEALEARVSDLAARPAPPDTAGPVIEELGRRLDEVQAAMSTVLASQQGFAQAQAALDGRVAALASSPPPSDTAGPAIEELGQRLDGVRAEVSAVATSQHDLARAHEALDGRLADLAASPAPSAGPLVEALGRRLDDVQAELRASFEWALGKAGQEAAERDRQVQQGMSRLSAMVEALRSDLETSIDTAVRFEMETARKAQGELSGAQRDIESRLHALERSVRDALERMAIPVDQPAPAAVVAASPAGTLLDGLEEQLRAAQRRLTDRAALDRMATLVGPREEPRTGPDLPRYPGPDGGLVE